MNDGEILERCFTDEQLRLILEFCMCSLSQVRVTSTQKAYYIWFPYFVLTSVDLEKILSFNKWFSVDSDSLLFIFDFEHDL